MHTSTGLWSCDLVESVVRLTGDNFVKVYVLTKVANYNKNELKVFISLDELLIVC